jgi:hypothetical protein
MKHSPQEIEFLQLVKELQKALASGLDSLGGKTPKNPEARYMGFVAKAVNTAADGYIVLREAYRVNASKLLIRPALEVILAAAAVENERGFLVRKAYAEWKDWGKMLTDSASIAQHQQKWDEFEKRVKAEDPSCPIVLKNFTVQEMSKLAKMEKHYEMSYRIYCKFTHGALDAIGGNLSGFTDDTDTAVMAWCAFQAIGFLQKHTPAKFPEMEELLERVDRLLFPQTEAGGIVASRDGRHSPTG